MSRQGALGRQIAFSVVVSAPAAQAVPSPQAHVAEEWALGSREPQPIDSREPDTGLHRPFLVL